MAKKELYKERGMPYFAKDHWQKNVDALDLGDMKYGSEFNQCDEYREMVDKQVKYAEKHRAEH